VVSTVNIGPGFVQRLLKPEAKPYPHQQTADPAVQPPQAIQKTPPFRFPGADIVHWIKEYCKKKDNEYGVKIMQLFEEENHCAKTTKKISIQINAPGGDRKSAVPKEKQLEQDGVSTSNTVIPNS